MLLLSAATIDTLLAHWPFATTIQAHWHRIAPTANSGKAACALLLGIVTWLVPNGLGAIGFRLYRPPGSEWNPEPEEREEELVEGFGRRIVQWLIRLPSRAWKRVVAFLYWFSDIAAVDRAIDGRRDSLELSLRDLLGKGEAAIFTLKSNKVYIGKVRMNFNPAFPMDWIGIVVYESGHRDPNTREYSPDLSYIPAHNHLGRLFRTQMVRKALAIAEQNLRGLPVETDPGVQRVREALNRRYVQRARSALRRAEEALDRPGHVIDSVEKAFTITVPVAEIVSVHHYDESMNHHVLIKGPIKRVVDPSLELVPNDR